MVLIHDTDNSIVTDEKTGISVHFLEIDYPSERRYFSRRSSARSKSLSQWNSIEVGLMNSGHQFSQMRRSMADSLMR